MESSKPVCRDRFPGWTLRRRDDGTYVVATCDGRELPVSREYVSKLIDSRVPEV